MTRMREGTFQAVVPSGTCRIAYTEWGDSDNPNIIICVHGLTRNSRDFDELAKALSEDYRVICPDMPGRGESENLTNPADYTNVTYATLMAEFMAGLPSPKVDWIGTSMGGLIGILLAAMPDSPIQRMVINDVGPVIPKTALMRIALYLGITHTFATQNEAEQHLRAIYAPFGVLSDEQWVHMVTYGTYQDEAGRWNLKYDPAISVSLKDILFKKIELWDIWDAIRCPCLLLRGENSDLLPKKTASAMLKRGPATQLVEFSGIGHAPSLMAPDQIQTVQNWLAGQG